MSSINEIHFDEIDSTSSYIKRNFDSLKDFTFVSSSFQSAGRGRQKRKWLARKGENLLFSFLLKEDKMINRYCDLSILSSYCIYKTLLERFSISSMFKWPNDIYIDSKKISGILLETHDNLNVIDGLIIGIGINVNQNEFEDDLIFPATSIKKIINSDVNIEKFKKVLFRNIIDEFTRFDKEDDYKEHIYFANDCNYLKNKKVYAIISGKKELVEIVKINDDCSLKVLLNGKEYNLLSGEITFHHE